MMVSLFLEEYNKLEKKIRIIFEKEVSNLPSKTKQKLYFYYGGKIATYLEYESYGIKLKELNYKESEPFK